jgi:DNA-binding protein HU-beta
MPIGSLVLGHAALEPSKLLANPKSSVQNPLPARIFVAHPRRLAISLVLQAAQENVHMSKSDFIRAVAKEGKVSKADAKRAVELVFDTIASGLKGVKGGGKLQIGTFGTFVTSKRAPRMGRNPRTGESIKIKASKSLRFRPATHLKKAAGC